MMRQYPAIKAISVHFCETAHMRTTAECTRRTRGGSLEANHMVAEAITGRCTEPSSDMVEIGRRGGGARH